MASQISDKTYEKFRNSISNQDLNELIELIDTMEINFKVRAKLKPMIQPLNESTCMEWGIKLSKMKVNHIIISGILFEKISIWSKDDIFTKDLIICLSSSDDWRIRDVSINLLFKGLSKEFTKFKKCFTKLTNSDDPNQRRVAIRVTKNISSLSTKNDEIKPWIYLKIEKYLYEKDDYVLRATFDTFTTGLIKNCPDLVIDSMDKLIQKGLNTKTKINILTAINGLVDTKYVEKLLNLIDYFVLETNENNKIAQLAVLRTLSRVDSKKVSIWLEERMSLENVVEYWAKLSIEGSIEDEFRY